jgi:hypothetical protein
LFLLIQAPEEAKLLKNPVFTNFKGQCHENYVPDRHYQPQTPATIARAGKRDVVVDLWLRVFCFSEVRARAYDQLSPRVPFILPS